MKWCGHTGFCCFLSEGDSEQKKNTAKLGNDPSEKTRFQEKSVRNQPIVDKVKILLLPLHIQLVKGKGIPLQA